LHTRIVIALFALSTGVSAQTADAIVAKIAAASMPSTITISTGGGKGIPGKPLTIPFTLALAGTTAPSSFQIDVTYDPTKLTFVSASAAASLTATAISTGVVRLTATSTSGMASGVVAYATFTMASPFAVPGTPLTLVNCMSASFGTPLSTGCSGGTVAAAVCTVSGDTAASVTDVQTMINEALGVSPAVNDLNLDGVIGAADVQTVIGAAMGRGCVL
jgi:hypothetical protein